MNGPGPNQEQSEAGWGGGGFNETRLGLVVSKRGKAHLLLQIKF